MTDSRPLKARILNSQFFIGAFATIGGGLFGLDISSMSGQLTNPAVVPGTIQQPKLFVAGRDHCLHACRLLGWSLDYIIRRKLCIIVSGLLWIVGSTTQSASYHVRDLVAGRVISGLSVGIASSIIPIYIVGEFPLIQKSISRPGLILQAEITKPGVRGRVVALQQWAITWGIFLQLWLMDNGREDEALKILADVHGAGNPDDELVQLEYNEIKQAAEFDRTMAARSYKDLLEPRIARRVWLGCSVQMWSQMCGMNVMMYYVVYVFQSAGITGRRGGLIASSVQWVLNVVMTVPALIYIDRWGRRPMLLIGSFLMCLFLFLVGGLMGHFGHNDPNADPDATTTWVITGHKSATYGIIVCSYFFVCSFVFPTRVRGKAVSIATATNWSFNFALAYFAPPALRNLQYKTYYLFAAMNAAAFINIFFCLPETCGRSLEEMDAVFESGHVFTAWKIKKDVGRKTLEQVLNDPEYGSPMQDDKPQLEKVEHKELPMSTV
ncbi:hypothetical protein RQP46_002663 [Phenoliferia psychrophenolica]